MIRSGNATKAVATPAQQRKRSCPDRWQARPKIRVRRCGCRAGPDCNFGRADQPLLKYSKTKGCFPAGPPLVKRFPNYHVLFESIAAGLDNIRFSECLG